MTHVDSRRLRRAHRGAWSLGAALCLVAGLGVGCSSSSGALTADSTCRQYLSRDANTRHDAAMRISAELHAEDAGNPMWGLNTDYVCSNKPSLKLRAAFGSGGGEPTPSDTAAAEGGPTDTPTESNTATDTETPTPTTSTPPSDALGQIVLSGDTIDNVCVADAGPDSTGQLDEVLHGAIAILECGSGSNTTVVGLDIPSGSVLWTHPLTREESSDDTTTTTNETVVDAPAGHVYVLAITSNPATGLAAAYITRTLTALDPRTGDQSWTQSLEPDDKQDDNDQATLAETAGPTDGATETVIDLDNYSAFDATTGKPLWRAHSDSSDTPAFVGYDLGLSTKDDETDGTRTDLVATNLATGRTVWADALPSDQTTISAGSYTDELVGHTYWTFSDKGYDAFDLLSGKHTEHAVYPTAWTNVLATPTYIAAQVDNTLRVFHTTSWAKPLWSVSSANTTPVAMTDKAVLVQADSGTLVLDMRDGSILNQSVDLSGDVSQNALVDGLLPSGNDVLELAPLT